MSPMYCQDNCFNRSERWEINHQAGTVICSRCGKKIGRATKAQLETGRVNADQDEKGKPCRQRQRKGR